MTKRTSFNITDENDQYLAAVAGSNKTDFLNDMIAQLRSGQITPAAKEGDGTDMNCIYNMAALSNAKIDFACPPKQHYPELAKGEKKTDLLKFCSKCPRYAEHMAMVKVKIKYPPAFERKVPNIEQDPEPVPQAPRPSAVSPSAIKELPAGLALVGCDSCTETFVFDDADNGLDEFLKHLQEKHGRHTVSNNEANQFRHARARLEKAVAKA